MELIAQSKAEARAPAFLSVRVTDDVVDRILSSGGNEINSSLRIYAQYQEGRSSEKIAQFLQKEYGQGGKGFTINGAPYSLWFNETGITVGSGQSALHSRDQTQLSWPETENRIRTLVQEGRFLPAEGFEEARENEFHELSMNLWYLRQDFSEEAVQNGFIPSISKMFFHRGGFPENIAEIYDALKTSDGFSAIADEMQNFCDAYQQNPELLRFHYHRPLDTLEKLKLLQKPALTFSSSPAFAAERPTFITQDEMDKHFTQGKDYSDTRTKIYIFFRTHKNRKEKQDFLKNLYGTGGGGSQIRDTWHDSKGVKIRRSDREGEYASVFLKWPKVEQRISDLIGIGQFMTPEDIAHIPDYERKVLARNVDSFFYFAHIDHPYEPDDFGDGWKNVLSMLREPEQTEQLLSLLKNTVPNLSPEMRGYDECLAAYRDLTAYQAGTYTLLTPTADKSNVLKSNNGQLSFQSSAKSKEEPEQNAATLKQAEQSSSQEKTYPVPKLPDVPGYLDLRLEYPNHIIGIQSGDLFLFFGKDAEAAAPALETKVLTFDIPELGETPVTGYSLGWAAAGENLLSHGHSAVFAKSGPDGYEILKSLEISDYIPIGMKLEEGGRIFTVESVDYDTGSVSLQDNTFTENAGYPISRVETVRTVREWVLEQNKIDTEQQVAAGTSLNGEYFSVPVVPEPQNFRITNDDLGAGGPKVKYRFNIAAIQTLRVIESENRTATPEEQEILSRYVGWGGIPQAFDENNASWSKEYAELKELLTGEEYAAARASVLNAHYTSPTVINGIYSTLEQFGFSSGNILEPACGVGNFFGLIPESMDKSKLYGVELDSITGRIAHQLYPKANINVDGFEKTEFPDDFFDLMVGNVPFGGYQLADRRYDRYKFQIHDYFIAKSLDKVRPGGLMAFLTSKGTMDKQNSDVRRYIAQRADLLGAVRLPNTAFLKNAGTEVTSDILFFQKRDRLSFEEPDWLEIGTTEGGVPVNRYFLDHPEMMLGTMAFSSRMYGNEKETTCNPLEGADFEEQLKTALSFVTAPNQEALAADELLHEESSDPAEREPIPADPDVRNFSYTIVNNGLYYRENSVMNPVDLPKVTLDRVCGMVELRDCTRRLIDQQLHGADDTEIQASQKRLNSLYDAFSKKHGLINSTGNKRAFEQDSSYCLLCSLEILDEKGNLEQKADMFTKRTIRQETVITSVDTASEALAASLSEKACVDLGYMGALMGGSDKVEKIITELQGVIFKDPESESDPFTGWKPADEYLSGNVRKKLEIAREAANENPVFAINVAALEKVQPKELTAAEISVRLGANWINPEYIDQFLYETFETPYSLQNEKGIRTQYSPVSGVWNISGKRWDSRNNIQVYTTFGTSRINAYKILEDTLNLKAVKIFDKKIDPDGTEHQELNAKETTLAQQKQDAIKEAFQNWIWKDPQRRDALCKKYNILFNSTRPREYDGSHLTFPGMNPEIKLEPHQLNAVARGLYGKNTLLAHCVGAGKTYDIIAIAMKRKQIGLCQKSIIDVPNHLTDQWGGDFLRLYPSANILVSTKKDFEPANRKKFCARIATGDYDAVIIGFSQFEKIPVSKERQIQMIQGQIGDIEFAIDQARQEKGENFTVKQMEKTRKSLETRLKRLNDDSRKDNVVTFEELGVDRLFVDEADNYKNLFLYTKMRNVAGIGQTEAQKSSDMFIKCRYMDELTDGRGTTFATGTPVSNSMTELYTMMRYLQYRMLEETNLLFFDNWAANFGETVTATELAPEGTGFRSKTRFAHFFNLPELMNLWKESADIQTADMLHLPVPKAEYINVVTQPSDFQKETIREFGERAEAVHRGTVDAKIDNMLKITSEGRLVALDQRLMNPLLPDDPDSKVNACVKNILNVWRESAPVKGAQLVFCDLSTPKIKHEIQMEMVDGAAQMVDGQFDESQFTDVYNDIRLKLIRQGIPEKEIEFIHSAKTEVQKAELFAKVRKGQVRVLLGSTAKMGAGTNVQDRLVALHHIDCPWKPRDIEQREGRILRQGNNNPSVKIFRYVTENTFDSYSWQLIENKQKFISQIMTSKSPARSCEDIDDSVLSYAEVKALATGDPRIKEKMDLDIQVTKLKMLKSGFLSQHYALEDKLLKFYPEAIQAKKALIEGITADQKHLRSLPEQTAENFKMVIRGMAYTNKKEAGMALIKECGKLNFMENKADVGEYLGFSIHIQFNPLSHEIHAVLKHSATHSAELGQDPIGDITRLNNLLKTIPQRLESEQKNLDLLNRQVQEAEEELKKEFPKEQELAEKSERLNQLTLELSLEKPEQIPLEKSEKGDSEIMPTSLTNRIDAACQSVPDVGQITRHPDFEKQQI